MHAPELTSIKSGEDISAEDISNISGVSKGTFYKLFRSADDFFRAVRAELSNDLIAHFKLIAIESPDYAVRVATKTRLGIRLMTKFPLVGRLLLKVDWHGYELNNVDLKDLEHDIEGGISQGRFSGIHPPIGVNIVLGGMKAAVREIIEKREPSDFADRATAQILVGLGLDAKSACELCEIPLPDLPTLTKGSLAERISSLKINEE